MIAYIVLMYIFYLQTKTLVEKGADGVESTDVGTEVTTQDVASHLDGLARQLLLEECQMMHDMNNYDLFERELWVKHKRLGEPCGCLMILVSS